MSKHPFRLVVTGSKGLVGSHIVAYAAQQGADVLGVDMVGRGNMTDYISADLTDLGQVYEVLKGADAVIHMAAINAQRIFPAPRTFIANLEATYNVFQVCAQLGIQRVVAASSIQVNHSCTPRTPIRYDYLPFDEAHPVDPQDEYSLSKYAGELCAETFAKHYGLTIVSMRLAGVDLPDKLAHLEEGQEPDVRTVLYSYVDPRDAARACYLAASVSLPPNTHTPLLIAARDTYMDMPSAEFAQRYYPGAQLRPGLARYGSLVSGAHAKEVLGFVAEYSCRGGEERLGIGD
jgi:nucleoside-diphosphate-sugar epimerase